MTDLPRGVSWVGVPPIKCQGIKTKLIPFIADSIRWKSQGDGRWVEPFLGSGVVALNIAPERALLSDTNKHIVGFYQGVYRGDITASVMREFLEDEGQKLKAGGAEYYYEVRQRFNEHGSPFDFIFLNRSCFNGVMRFNRKGGFNVPFGHKPERFAKAYVTKIVNQVNWVAKQMSGKDWEFRVAPWEETLSVCRDGDFAYIDPPYIGRHTDYYNTWDDDQAMRLAEVTQQLPGGYAVSMWLENVHRKNEHIADAWAGAEMRVCTHYYHVGASEDLRNEMEEALLIKPGFATDSKGKHQTKKPTVAEFDLFHLPTEPIFSGVPAMLRDDELLPAPAR